MMEKRITIQTDLVYKDIQKLIKMKYTMQN